MIEARSDVFVRPYADSDAGLLFELLGDPVMTVYLGGPESDEALTARHQRYLAADPSTHGLFTIVVGDGRVAAGWVGYWESEWEDMVDWEIGWHVSPAFQRAGVASTAGRLALESASQRHRHRWVHAFPSVENDASNSLCRSLGFEALGHVDVEYPKGRLMRSEHWRFDLDAPRSG